MWETWVRSWGWEDPLEKEQANHSSILENSMNYIVHGISEELDTTEWLSLLKQTARNHKGIGNSCVDGYYRLLQSEWGEPHRAFLHFEEGSDYETEWENGIQESREERGSKAGIRIVYCKSIYIFNMFYTVIHAIKHYIVYIIQIYIYIFSFPLGGWSLYQCLKPKMESRLPGEILKTSDRQMTPPLWQRVKRN